jgi:hypothetical protein
MVNTPKTNRIPFGIVSVLARMMLAYDRLVRRCGSSPRARRRRAASTSVSPVDAISLPVAIHRHYRDSRDAQKRLFAGVYADQ